VFQVGPGHNQNAYIGEAAFFQYRGSMRLQALVGQVNTDID
jgi:hypothetical protein